MRLFLKSLEISMCDPISCSFSKEVNHLGNPGEVLYTGTYNILSRHSGSISSLEIKRSFGRCVPGTCSQYIQIIGLLSVISL